MEKVLVTGAAGFIGSHLVEALLNQGVSVVAIDNFSNGKKENRDYLLGLKSSNNLAFIEGDLRSVDFCNQICSGVKYIYHQAALGSVPRSVNEPQLYFDNNLGGMINLLESARKHEVKRFIFASSSSVYGDTPTLPKIETMPLNPKSPYAASKAAGEHYLKVYQDVYGLETIGFRYFNVFGPRQDPFSQYAAVIPKFFDQCFTNQSITINGNGDQTRDFTYIQNVIQFNLNAMHSNKESTGRVYNVGCEQNISINGLANKIKQLTNSSQDVTYRPSRAGDVKDSLADTELAKKYLHIKDLIHLDDGLSATFEWYTVNNKIN
ncbi:MAG: SDR family oxidoreductase [Candidatus Margulisiibacteriota bacterium]